MLERVVDVAGGEHEQLGIEPLERLLQLILPLDLHDDLDRVAELDVLVAGAHDARVAGRTRRGQDRQAARGANRIDLIVGQERLGAAGLGLPRFIGTGHGDDQRDPVALGDGLAQTSGAGHASQHYRSWLRFSRARASRDRPAPRGAAHRRFRRRPPAHPRDCRARTSSPAGTPPIASSREPATTGSRPSTTAASTGSRAARA